MKKLILFLLIIVALSACSLNSQEIQKDKETDKIVEDKEYYADVSEKLDATLIHNLQTVGDNVYLISYNRDSIYDDGFDAKVSVLSFKNDTVKKIYEWHSFLDPKYYFQVQQIEDSSIMIYAGNFLMNHKENDDVDYQQIHSDYYYDADYDFVNNRLFFIPENDTKSLLAFSQHNSEIEKIYTLKENEENDFFLLSVQVSPDGEKILTKKAVAYHQVNVICLNDEGKEIFAVDTPTKDVSVEIDWINNDEFVCYYPLENGNTKFIIYGSDGSIQKEFEVSFVISEAQHNFSKSYPFGIFCSYGDVTLKGLESELWIVDFEKGIGKKVHEAQETIHAFDLTEGGKSVVWSENLKVCKKSIL